MTRRDLFVTLNEPFSNPGFLGPEARAERARPDGKLVVDPEYASCTFSTTVSLIESANTMEKTKRAFVKEIAYTLGSLPYRNLGLVRSLSDNAHGEPDNPTAVPLHILKDWQWSFLIRHPRSSVPSMYRLSVPPMSEKTGWDYFIPNELGYRELRNIVDFLFSKDIISRENVCLVDADDLLDNPSGVIAAYCQLVGIDYKPEMLTWDTSEDQAHCREIFRWWMAFHEDAMQSSGLKPRKSPKASLTVEEEDQKWFQTFGKEGARIIRSTVNSYIEDYDYLKSFALKL
ncbi:hypothetical protein MMC13_003307 [Lambiella insularis]|nr:hypothetical protein [Lambiella insularis]